MLVQHCNVANALNTPWRFGSVFSPIENFILRKCLVNFGGCGSVSEKTTYAAIIIWHIFSRKKEKQQPIQDLVLVLYKKTIYIHWREAEIYHFWVDRTTHSECLLLFISSSHLVLLLQCIHIFVLFVRQHYRGENTHAGYVNHISEAIVYLQCHAMFLFCPGEYV